LGAKYKIWKRKGGNVREKRREGERKREIWEVKG
jgi:hypothetical protein